MAKLDPRRALDELIKERGESYSSVSRLLSRNAAYIQQFIKRGTPRRLPEKERGVLARYFGVDERVLGGPEPQAGKGGMRKVPKLAVAASAGFGSFGDGEQLAGQVGFDEKWLRQMGVDPARVAQVGVGGLRRRAAAAVLEHRVHGEGREDAEVREEGEDRNDVEGDVREDVESGVREDVEDVEEVEGVDGARPVGPVVNTVDSVVLLSGTDPASPKSGGASATSLSMKADWISNTPNANTPAIATAATTSGTRTRVLGKIGRAHV